MKNFSNLSIRARVAYACICLEQLLKKRGSDSLNNWNVILENLWSYTEANVGEWHYRMAEMIPFAVEEDIPYENKDCEFINKNEHEFLKQLYQDAQPEEKQIVDLTFEIGTMDLYSSITDDSPRTVELLEQIVQILQDEGLTSPDLSPLLRFNVVEEDGWGRKFRKSDIFLL